MTPVEFDTALQRLRPNSVDFQLQVDDLIGCVDRAFNNALVNFVFDFFERYPNEDLGSPGGLVHFVERSYPEYKARLLFSLRKAPSLSVVWMTNRILNAAWNRWNASNTWQPLDLFRGTFVRTLGSGRPLRAF